VPPAAQLYAENLSLKEENTVLRAQIAWLKQQLFGGGQSDRLDRVQLILQLGELEKLADAAAPVQTITYERTKPTGEKRSVPAATFAHLPVKETIVIEPEAVKAEPAAYERIGEERTFEVDVVPPQLFKREIVRPKYQRKQDKTEAPRGRAGAGSRGFRRVCLGGAFGVDCALQVCRPPAAFSPGANVGAVGCAVAEAKHGRVDPPHRRVVRTALQSHARRPARQRLRAGGRNPGQMQRSR